MLRSMTAFGSAQHNSSGGEFICEIRSVNHRYIDVSVRLDSELRFCEPLIRERTTSLLTRGKVEVLVRHTMQATDGDRLQIDQTLLEDVWKQAAAVAARNPDLSNIDVVRLLQWPGLIKPPELDREQVQADALHAVDQALADLQANREREGQAIAQMLTERVEQIQELVTQVRAARPAVVQAQRERLARKLEKLSLEHDQDRLEQELVYAAQRLDVDEELDRLDAHVAEWLQALSRTEAVGRRLDFLLQEFNREANTLASKSNDSETTARTVDMKVLIEQMREQVQNIE